MAGVLAADLPTPPLVLQNIPAPSKRSGGSSQPSHALGSMKSLIAWVKFWSPPESGPREKVYATGGCHGEEGGPTRALQSHQLPRREWDFNGPTNIGLMATSC